MFSNALKYKSNIYGSRTEIMLEVFDYFSIIYSLMFFRAATGIFIRGNCKFYERKTVTRFLSFITGGISLQISNELLWFRYTIERNNSFLTSFAKLKSES